MNANRTHANRPTALTPAERARMAHTPRMVQQSPAPIFAALGVVTLLTVAFLAVAPAFA